MKREELQYTDGIDANMLIKFLIEKHDLEDGGKYAETFAIMMLEKTIQYGIKRHNVSKDELAYYLMDVIPELEFTEATAFIIDDQLTGDGLKHKNNFWDIYTNPDILNMMEKLTPENQRKLMTEYYKLLSAQDAENN